MIQGDIDWQTAMLLMDEAARLAWALAIVSLVWETIKVVEITCM